MYLCIHILYIFQGRLRWGRYRDTIDQQIPGFRRFVYFRVILDTCHSRTMTTLNKRQSSLRRNLEGPRDLKRSGHEKILLSSSSSEDKVEKLKNVLDVFSPIKQRAHHGVRPTSDPEIYDVKAKR